MTLARRSDQRGQENVWSTIRHHTSSWLLLWRLLVLAVGIATLVGGAAVLLWFLGMRIGIAGFELAPA